MAKHYSPRNFFRQVPNKLLAQYFSKHGLMTNIDFSKLSETKIDAVYEEWLRLPEDVRNNHEQQFQEINEMATEGGSKAILDEANYYEENLAEKFAGFKGFYERAFWTYLERPYYWKGATVFRHADTIPQSYWRKRKNLPRKPANVNNEAIKALEYKLSDYFHHKEGRGKNCQVECYKRNELDYFFAYPEDYAQASIEWDKKALIKRHHHPAFENIFVFSSCDGTLDIYTNGNKKIVADLQAIFSETILNAKLVNEVKDNRVYDLRPLLSRSFQFIYSPSSGIIDTLVTKFRLVLYGQNEYITLQVDPSEDKYSIYNLLEKIGKSVYLPRVGVTQVRLKVKLAHPSKPDKHKTVSFDITYPNSCNLKHNDENMVIRKMLLDSGIEAKHDPGSIAQEGEAA